MLEPMIAFAAAAIVTVSCTGPMALGSDQDPGPGAGIGGGGSGGYSFDGSSTGGSGGVWVNHADCPTAPPAEESECSVPEATTCVYAEDNECTCLMDVHGTTRFHCLSHPNFYACPTEMPEHGSECTSSFKGMQCHYPLSITCECTGMLWWSCPAYPSDYDIFAHDLPTGIDPNRVVKDMTEEEAQTWCKWYVSTFTPVGWPEPECVPRESQGGMALGAFFGGCYNRLCATQCESSLKQLPCEATVGALSDCVLSTVATFKTPRPWGYGCGHFLMAPNCTGVIVGPPEGWGTPYVDGGPEKGPCPVLF